MVFDFLVEHLNLCFIWEKLMNNINRLKIRYLLAYMTVAVLSYGSPGIATADPLPDVTFTYPADTACTFELFIEGWDGNKRNIKEFKDGNNVVRTLSAGTGSALRFTNTATKKTISTKSNGAVTDTRYNLDGSFTQTGTGHIVLILWPTDVPAGPSTTLYVGQVVISSDPSFKFTVEKESGNKTDICAALS